jgi:hypothetical protein
MLRMTQMTVGAAVISLAGLGASTGGVALADDKKPAAKQAQSVRSHDRGDDHRGRGDDKKHDGHDRRGSSHGDHDRDKDRGHPGHAGHHGYAGPSHSYRPSHGHSSSSHSYDHGSYGHSSYRKPCGHIGACPTRPVQVCVRAGYYENRYVPAVTQVCYDSYGRPYTKVICAAHWTKAWVPPAYETRHVSACDSHSHRTGWSFSFGF